jgi:peroxiredoxin family protein
MPQDLTLGTVDIDTIRQIVREEIQAALKKDPASRKACFIASKGTLDWAYPPLILSTAAAAANMDAAIFFTFYGLNIIRKDFERVLRVSPVGNPAMPMPVPMPQLLTALPGMTPMATWMMKRQFKDHGVASIDELVELCVELGVKMIPCGMTMDVFGFSKDGFIDGIEPVCGATHFLDWAADADVSLFI